MAWQPQNAALDFDTLCNHYAVGRPLASPLRNPTEAQNDYPSHFGTVSHNDNPSRRAADPAARGPAADARPILSRDPVRNGSQRPDTSGPPRQRISPGLTARPPRLHRRTAPAHRQTPSAHRQIALGPPPRSTAGPPQLGIYRAQAPVPAGTRVVSWRSDHLTVKSLVPLGRRDGAKISPRPSQQHRAYLLPDQIRSAARPRLRRGTALGLAGNKR
jgi:hypothetical protein